MERKRMVGDFELIYEPDMKMYRIMKKETEEMSAWYSREEAEKLQQMDEDEFFETAEKAVQKNKEQGRK